MGNSIVAQWNPLDPSSRLRTILPGMVIAIAVTVLAFVIAAVEKRAINHEVLEPLVLALIIGLLVRLAWIPSSQQEKGIAFAGKQLLEFAIVILGLTLNLNDIVDAGWKIIGSVLLLVSMTLIVGTYLGRAMGLDKKLATLVAVGNAICGNSAIAACAPSIRAKKTQVAAAISLTAIFGVFVVLALPLLVPILNLSDTRYGVMAGLSVYAVPQVLAATFSVSAQAGQIGSLVKLTRVVMLGPVVALMAWLYRNEGDDTDEERPNDVAPAKTSISKFLPWFVIGFFICAILRTTGIIPSGWIPNLTNASKALTAVAMAGLGLGVDIRQVREMGGRVIVVVMILTSLLVVSSYIITGILHIG